jgi:hypothetical protein
VGNEVFVSERQAHRIAAYDKKTGAYIRTLVQGPALAAVDQNRRVRVIGTLAQRRAAPCVAPEGIGHWNGWMYFGSVAQGQVRRIRLNGTDNQVVYEWDTDDNSYFCQIAVSDGSCFPGGTIAVMTFSSGLGNGLPQVILPDGRVWSPGKEAEAHKGGGWCQHYAYTTASAFGEPGFLMLGVGEGAQVISQRNADEPVASPAAIRGEKKWLYSGLRVPHGPGGFPHTRLPLPWGSDPDIDAYLMQMGHVRP